MSFSTPRASFGGSIYLMICLVLGAYFAFSAIQGESGVLQQRQVAAEALALKAERDLLADDLAEIRNLTLRLSDTYLDLDLLDERARSVLGYVRADEIVLR